MPRRSGLHGMGQSVQSRAVPGSPITRTCDDCGAGPGVSCMKLSSWIPSEHGRPGFYTQKQKRFHPSRLGKSAVSDAEAARRIGRVAPPCPVDFAGRPPGADMLGETMGLLRQHCQDLIFRKLPPAKRREAMRFLHGPRTTDRKIEALIGRLETLPDWAPTPKERP